MGGRMAVNDTSESLPSFGGQPYRVGGAVGERQFAGRARLLETLKERFKERSCPGFLLRGPRRWGKSSVLTRFKEEAQREAIVIYLDLAGIFPAKERWEAPLVVPRVLERLLRAYVEGDERGLKRSLPDWCFDLAGRSYENTGISAFNDKVLPELRRAVGDTPLVILLDEMEVVAYRDRHAPGSLAAALLPSTGGGNPPFLGIAWGRPFGAGTSGYQRDVFADFYPHDLKQFTATELGEALRKPVRGLFDWSDKAVTKVEKLTSGHPLFTAALGAAVFENRADDDRRAVSAKEVDAAIDDALKLASHAFSDPWGQLSREHKLLLRAVADQGARNLAEVARWIAGIAPDVTLGDPRDVLNPLKEDALLDDQSGALKFVVEMIRRWVAVRTGDPQEYTDPGMINSDVIDPRVGALLRRGIEHQTGRRFAQAASLFEETLSLDPDRVEAATRLADVAVQVDDPERTLPVLRAANAGSEVVRKALARVLAVCLTRAIERHGNAGDLLSELETLDPDGKYSEIGATVVARVRVADWLDQHETARPDEADEATKREVLERGARFVETALGRVRSELESLAEGEPASRGAEYRILHVVPYLLLKSEPGNGGVRGVPGWERCYELEVAALRRVALSASLGAHSLPPQSIFRLLSCRIASTEIAQPLRDLVPTLVAADRIAALCLSEPSTARAAAVLLDYMPRPEARRRLEAVIASAAESAAHCDPGTDPSPVICATRSHPSVGLHLFRLLGDGDMTQSAAASVDVLVYASELLLDRLRSEPGVAALALDSTTSREWVSLLGALRSREPKVSTIEAALAKLLKSPEPAPSGAPDSTRRRSHVDRSTIQTLLGPAYAVDRPIPYRVHGIPPGYISAWSVYRSGGRELLARAYRVDAGEQETRAFLRYLWENEQRLLAKLATRWEGRALPRLHISRFEPDEGLLILVTDMVGPRSLRDLLDSGEITRLRRTSRSALWTLLRAVVEALGALHAAGYIHRAVRPENILEDPEGHMAGKRARLRLANFEWAVYLHGLSDSRARPILLTDRYIAPERLALHRPSPNGVTGEGMGTDTFALGLILFECVIEQLHPDELGLIPPDYTREQHVAWIDSLLARVDRAWREGALFSDEVFLLKRLLDPDASSRRGDIGSILDLVSKLGERETVEQAASHAAAPLSLVTTLEPGTPESIAGFIREDLPSETFRSEGEVKRWIEKQLANAKVYPNRRAGAPLLLVCDGESTVNFTVEPFLLRGKEWPQVGWLKVAKELDGAAGETLGSLECPVVVHNYDPRASLTSLQASPNGWTPLFAAVERMSGGLTGEERAFLDRVAWSVQLELESWRRHVFPYKRVHYAPSDRPGEDDIVIITGRSDPRGLQSFTLAESMAQSVDRDNVAFELGHAQSPIAGFDPARRWVLVESDATAEGERIRLTRPHREGLGEPPDVGWVRPFSLAGNRVLHDRHREVLADVRRDTYLVRSLVSPRETFDDLNLPHEACASDGGLDEDKIALAGAIGSRRPLFVIQGPPGTGKTTLAAEVILRTLRENPSSRILVVAQAHDPLNNLLVRVADAVAAKWGRLAGKAPPPISVRLSSEERLDERRYGKESVRVLREYHPARVTALILRDADDWTERWTPGRDDVGAEAVEAWKRVRFSQQPFGLSRSLERRLVNSANLVYATSNDRRLATTAPGSFDLVIYEEAAKALPAEVLAPMRLARRWLLIGDQQQLPPFALQDIDIALKDAVEKLRRQRRTSAPAAADRNGIDPESIRGARSDGDDVWTDAGAEMRSLLRFFNYIYTKSRFDPPGRSEPEGLAGTPGAIKGLTGMLTTQWRMHPTIGTFVSECFYDGRIQNGGDPKALAANRRHGLFAPPEIQNRPIVWLDVPWVVDFDLATERRGFGGGWENGFEARVVIGFLRELLRGTRARPDIAILSPYRAQVSALGMLLRDHVGLRGFADALHTADSFQGNQAHVCIVSLVRNNPPSGLSGDAKVRRGLGFLAIPERSTVIFSRAERLLVLVGCRRHFKQFPGTPTCRVVDYIETLASRENSGVTILEGGEFLDERVREDLQAYDMKLEERRLRRREREDGRLGVGRKT